MAAAIAEGLRAGGVDAVEMPVADGGEGTMDALLATLEGELRTVEVGDPLGNPVQAAFALLGDGATAFVECAQASGMGLVPEEEIDAVAASTRGTGELIVAACEAGARDRAGGRGRLGHHRRRGGRGVGGQRGRGAPGAGGGVRRAHAVRGRAAGVRAPEGRDRRSR